MAMALVCGSKRSLSDWNSDDLSVPHKRWEGGGVVHLEARAESDVQAFMHGLSRGACMSECQLFGPGCELFWQAFAEMNQLLENYFASLPTSALRGYHSFTRCSKAAMWSR